MKPIMRRIAPIPVGKIAQRHSASGKVLAGARFTREAGWSATILIRGHHQ
jgi:hypothetical protein